MKFSKLISAAAAAAAALNMIAAPSLSYADASSDMDSTLDNYWGFCAAEIYSMNGEKIYSYKEDSPVFCASVIKLPYAVFVCHEIEAGRMSLDDTFTFTGAWDYGGSGIIKDSAYGSVYTVRQLIDYMLRYSDNIAYNMLVYLFGTEGFNAMVKEWGFDVELGDPYPRWPDITAEFMCRSMKEMYRHHTDSESWTVSWDALLNSTRGITRDHNGGENIPVAIKYGKEECMVYHETCYVGAGFPYIYVILSEINSDYTDYDFIGRAADCADAVVKEYAEKTEAEKHRQNEARIQMIKNLRISGDISALKLRLLYPDLRKFTRVPDTDINHDGTTDSLDYLLLRCKQLIS